MATNYELKQREIQQIYQLVFSSKSSSSKRYFYAIIKISWFSETSDAALMISLLVYYIYFPCLIVKSGT